MTRHELDQASTTALRPVAREAMVAALSAPTADPGRIHAEGMRARHDLEVARETVADLLGARSREVIFTSGATEAIVTAVQGAVTFAPGREHVVLSAVEHSAVRKAVERWAGAVTVVGVGPDGIVDPDEVAGAIGPSTGLVCVQWANHEVGAIQPVADVVTSARAAGALVLVDAAMAVGHLPEPVSFGALGADLLAVSAHKFGGPAGTGALLVRRGLRIDPLLVGGDQERARRAGLENLVGAAGMAAACAELAEPGRTASEHAAAQVLTDRIRALSTRIDGVTTFGPTSAEQRLPHLVCLGVDGVEPQGVLLGLDQAGIAAHSGSSCSSESLEPSPVLEAMGVDAHRSLRLSVGWSTTAADIDALEAALPAVIERLRALGAR